MLSSVRYNCMTNNNEYCLQDRTSDTFIVVMVLGGTLLHAHGLVREGCYIRRNL